MMKGSTAAADAAALAWQQEQQQGGPALAAARAEAALALEAEHDRLVDAIVAGTGIRRCDCFGWGLGDCSGIQAEERRFMFQQGQGS